MISADQFRRVAQLTQTYSRGRAEITNRQSIQLHWVEADDAPDIFAELERIGFTTDMCGQGFSGARLGDVRNIVCCPVSGIAKNEILDGSSLLRRLTGFFVGNPDFLDLPRKIKFSISGCGCDCTRAWINDVAFVAVNKGDETGYTLLIGGSSGTSLPGPRISQPTRVFVRPEKAFDLAVAIAEIHRDYGNRESRRKARLKWLIEEWGLDRFLRVLEKKIGYQFEAYDGPVFRDNGDHGSIQQQSENGYHVSIPLVDGRLSSEQMNLIADLSVKYGSGELRLTSTQNIVIPNVETVDVLTGQLESHFTLRGPRLKWTSIACSSDFCGKSVEPHSKKLLADVVEYLESRFTPQMLDETKVRIHVSGCINNCCPANTAEIGMIGKQIKVDGETKQTYDILLGGSLGVDPSFSRLIEAKVNPTEIKFRIASLLDNFIQRKTPEQSFNEFCDLSGEKELQRFLRMEDGE